MSRPPEEAFAEVLWMELVGHAEAVMQRSEYERDKFLDGIQALRFHVGEDAWTGIVERINDVLRRLH